MFYLYSNQGLNFSGTLEQLKNYRKVYKTAALEKANATHKTLADQETEFSIDQGYTASKQALAQYQQTLQENQAPEAVYHAFQIMSHPIVSVQGEDSLKLAYQAFEQHNFHLLPILNRQRLLIGVLSRLDFYRDLLQGIPQTSLDATTVSNYLSNKPQEVISAAPVTDIRRIAAVLTDEKLDAVPIVEENGQVVGIVSRTDIIKTVMQEPPLSLWA